MGHRLDRVLYFLSDFLNNFSNTRYVIFFFRQTFISPYATQDLSTIKNLS